MDFESFIWIIIFLIYVASVIWKRVRSASKAGEKVTAKKPSGWKEKLVEFRSQFQKKAGGFLAQIQQEMEAAQQKDSKKETGWEKFLLPKDDEPVPAAKKTEMMDVSPEPIQREIKADVTPEYVEPIRKETVFQKMEQPVKATPSLKRKPFVEKDVAEKKEPAVSEKEIFKKDMPYGIQDLRRAVIWSEILAPPLALRDE